MVDIDYLQNNYIDYKSVTIDLNHIEYIKEDKMIAGKSGTIIYFTSGNKVFVEEKKYDSVRDMLNTFKIGY